MSDDLQSQMDRLKRKLAGDGPIQKQIILLKLTDLYENRPENFGQHQIGAGSPEREWLSAVGALINRYDSVHHRSTFNAKMMMLNTLGNAFEIVGVVSDVIEAIKLELELDGRSEIGTIYQPGDVYRFYADLKEVIGGADKEIFLIEPYLTGPAFDEYFGAVRDTRLQLLISKKSAEIKTYADRHSQQYETSIEVRQSNEIHDRLIIADQADTWVIGGSLNQKGDKPTYLLPLTLGVAQTARDLYSEVWDRANAVI